MNPNVVISPKSKIEELEVLYNQGEYSVASVLWNGKKRIVIRWNGNGEELGYPQSHGFPTWFVIPKDVALAYVQTLKNSSIENIVKASSDEPFV